MTEECNTICEGKNKGPSGLDQGLTHHVITFKTNNVFVDKKLIGLDAMIDQTVDAIAQYDEVCFTA